MTPGTKHFKRLFRDRATRVAKLRYFSFRRFIRFFASKSDRDAQAWCRQKGIKWS